MKKRIKIIGIGIIISISSISAQKGVDTGTQYGSGEDSIRCIRNFSLYSEDFKNRNYNDAFPSWLAVLEECPMAHVNIYLDGVRLVKDQMDKTNDPAKIDELFQLLMRVYDMRMLYFGDNQRTPTPAIKGLKALDMLDYEPIRNDVEVVKTAFQMLTESVEAIGKNSQLAVLQTYMGTATRLYIQKEINAEQYINCFTTVADIVDTRLKDESINESTRKGYEQVKFQSEQWFAETDVASCENLENIFGPQLEENKEDLEWLKRVSSWLARKNCTESEFFYLVAQFQHEIKPSGESAFGMAKRNMKPGGDVDKALEYFLEAVELADNDDLKGLCLLNIAQIHYRKQNYQLARSFSLRAIEARPNWGQPFIMIGMAYAMSATNFGKDDFEQKTVYWAAVDKFIRARTVDSSFAEEANNLIRTYSAHFPSNEEIFMQGFKSGDSYTVEGWINERTTVRTR